MPFAFFAVAALRPRIMVELGTWKGDSYCALCQAVETLELETRCYAVDTWEGDAHTGRYGPEILEDLRAHHDPLYGGSFSQPAPADVRRGGAAASRTARSTCSTSTARTATRPSPTTSRRGCRSSASEGSSCFTTRACARPISASGASGTSSRATYPGFAFPHGHGLGVLAVGRDVDADFLDFLAAANSDPLAARFFSALGSRIAATGPRATRPRRGRAEAEAAAQPPRLAAAVERGATARRADRRGELDALRAERDRLETQLRALDLDLANVVHSISWRVTAPLRRAKRMSRRARRASRRFRRRPSRPARARRRSPRPPTARHRARPRSSSARSSRSSLRSTTPTPSGSGGRSSPSGARPIPTGSSASPTTARPTSARSSTCAALAAEPGIEVSFGDANRGIAAATNRALETAEGEFVAFLDHDDELDPDALLECVRLLNEKPDTDAIYTDEDKIDRRGAHSEPFFKPDWSPELFRGVMYVGHLLVVRRSLVESVGGLDSAFDGVQDFELMLRISEQTDRIEHVPRILYHWRKLPGSVAQLERREAGISELQAARSIGTSSAPGSRRSRARTRIFPTA